MESSLKKLRDILSPSSQTAEIEDLVSGNIFSLAKIESLADLRADELHRNDYRVKQKVLLLQPNSVNFFIELFALWKIGAFPFIANADITQHEKALLLERIQNANSPLPDDTAFVLLTSGSSATPKAVVHTFDGIKQRLEILKNAIPDEDRKNVLCSLPLSFGHGLIGLSLLALASGHRLILTPGIGVKNLSEIQLWLTTAKPSFISLTPALWELVLRYSKNDFKSLKRVQIASAFTPAQLFERVRNWAECPVYNVYGMTEGASWISDFLYERSGDENCVGNGKNWQTKFRVSTEPRSLEGPIEVKLPGLFWGYWDYHGDTYKDQDDWFFTGDHGILSENGNLNLIGRLSRIINRKGYKVSAEEVENCILLVADVKEACVLGVGPQQADIGAFIVLNNFNDNSPLFCQNLIEKLSEKLTSLKIPSTIKIIEKIPRKSNGKLDLLEIKKLWDQN